MKKRILSFILVFTILLSAYPLSTFAENSKSIHFTDLTGYEKYNDYIMYTSVYNNYIIGTNPPDYTNFSPAKPLDRAMLVTILYRMAGAPYDTYNPYKHSPFTDVKNKKTYFYNAICWALDNEITNQTFFNPHNNVTREQTARFLFAYSEANNMLCDKAYKNINLTKYPDYKSVHNWAKEALQWANYNNMITGTQQGYINPQGATQRIHAARILSEFGNLYRIGNCKPLPYTPIPHAMILAENKNTVTNESVKIFSKGQAINISKNEWSISTGNDIISNEMLYFPYGSAVRIYTNKLKELGYNSFDFRMYRYSENNEYLGEVNQSYLCPETNIDNDMRPSNFVVTDKNGIYVKIRWVKWENNFTDKTAQDLADCFSIYSLTDINAEIFSNSTITKCWNNEANYEAWPSKCIFFNPNNNLYYAFYASQSAHNVYNGKILYRTSTDLISWSNSVIVWDNNTNSYPATINGAVMCSNGDILISVLCGSTVNNRQAKSMHLRSTDNGITWEIENFILDGENATGIYRTNRERLLDDGRIFSCYFDNARKEKVGICYSNDNGHTWTSSEFSTNFNLNDNGEYDFTLLNNGNILCIERTPNGIAASISIDNGLSFINETSLNFIDIGGQMNNCPFIKYDKKNDRLTIYEVDRFITGALIGIYTSGKNISDFLLNKAEFKGFQTNVCSLGLNGNSDMGYSHIIEAPDKTVKCFYYSRTNGEASTASWYYISTI